MDDFERIRKEFETYDAAREAVIKEARGILKASKQAIYALHRGDSSDALLAEAKKIKEKLESSFIDGDPRLRTGGFSNACEEYAEALSFAIWLKEGRLMTLEESGVNAQEFLGGLADLTGELGRRAVILATERNVAEVKKIKDFTEQLYGEFVKFNFRNGDLRRKYDSIKYNLQKMENVLYDLTIHEK